MAWRIDTDLQPGYLMLRIIGNAEARVTGEIVAAVYREIMASNRSKVIVDIREVDGRLTVLETFNMVSGFPSLQGIRAAVIDRPENNQWFEFYETVSVNRGYCNKVFTEMEIAMDWLEI